MVERAIGNRLLVGVCVIGAALACGGLGGCESETADQTPPASPDTSTERAPAPAAEEPLSGAADRLGGMLAEGRDKAVESAREGLNSAETRLAELRAKAEAVAADKRPAFDRAIADAEAHARTLKTKVEELGRAGADAWQGISADIKAQAAKLGESLERAEEQTE